MEDDTCGVASVGLESERPDGRGVIGPSEGAASRSNASGSCFRIQSWVADSMLWTHNERILRVYLIVATSLFILFCAKAAVLDIRITLAKLRGL